MTKLTACDIPFSAYDFTKNNLMLNITTDWLQQNVNHGSLCPRDEKNHSATPTFDFMNFFECLEPCVDVKQAIFEQIWTGDNRDQLHATSIDDICKTVSDTKSYPKIDVMFANHPSNFWTHDWCQKEHCSREGLILGLMVITLFSFASRVGSYFQLKNHIGKIGTHRFSNLYLILNMIVISVVVAFYWFSTYVDWLKALAITLVVVIGLMSGLYLHDMDAKSWVYPMHRFGIPLLISSVFLFQVIIYRHDDYNQATNMHLGIYLTSYFLFFLPPILEFLIYCKKHYCKNDNANQTKDPEPSREKVIVEFFFLGVHILLMIYMWLIAIESKPYRESVPYLATVLVIVANVPEFLKLNGVLSDQSSRKPFGNIAIMNKNSGRNDNNGTNETQSQKDEAARDGMNKRKCFTDYCPLIVSVLLFFVLVVVGTIYAICEIFHFHGSGQFIGSFSFTLAVLYAMTPLVINFIN
jgi:hypothetical protein